MAQGQPTGSYQAKAESYVQDRAGLRKLIQNVLSKAYEHREQLVKVWDDLLALCRMIKSWANGRYRRLPWKTITLAVAAVVYFLDPLDLAPDFIPGVGYLDDAAVIGFVVNSIRSDLEKFQEWERQGA